MLENLFTNVFGRPKNKSSGRSSQSEIPSGVSSPGQMSGPFSVSTSQMPQPPNSPYPPVPYPSPGGQSAGQSSYYPPLPFSQPPAMPTPYPPFGGAGPTYGTLAAKQTSPLDSVPFEARLSLNNSSTIGSLDQLFKEIKKAADTVERADAYLKSNQSDYNFKIEQGLIYH